ncbi:lipoprotein N-acyltransferase Lnb domain-containing protein [Lutibacter sp.]
MNTKLIVFFLLIYGSFSVTAQQKLSPKATISVVTCGPGNELYSTFGHSAFRVYDPTIGLDKIYNYGTFNFNAPNFYLNFLKGDLIYQLSTSSFNRFLRIYNYENRWVKTQELAIDTTEVQAIFDYLENNAKPQNKSYRYDFFYNNCSTKIEEVVKTVLKDKVDFSNTHITSSKTHRDLIADYTKKHKWSKFGIDLALGSVIDKKATKDNYKFLPDYIYLAFENATIKTPDNTKKLVKKSRTILKEKKVENTSTLFQPLLVFVIIALLIVIITYKNYVSKKRSKWLDFILFLTTGLVGIVVLLLWFATAHTATYKNFNFLWAFAPNLITAFYLLKSKLPKWVLYYNWVLVVLLGVLLVLWLLQIQVFNTALIPFFMAIAIRYYYLITVGRKEYVH